MGGGTRPGAVQSARSWVNGVEPNGDPSDDQTELVQFDYYSRFVHELGHGLSLGHGGTNGTNCKPNYPSLMNYAFDYDFNHTTPPPIAVSSFLFHNHILMRRGSAWPTPAST